MFEKILQKLKTQREDNSNVSDRSLEDLARSLETVITTDEALEKVDLSPAIKSLDGNINHYTAEAVKNAKKAEEDAAAQKKKEEEDKKKKESASKSKKEDEIPAWAQQLMEQNENLTNKFESLQSEKAASTRREKLQKLFTTEDGEKLPDFYTQPILEAFNQTKFENDEDFSKYVDKVKSNTDSFRQQVKEKGINFGAPRKDVQVPEETGETPTLSEARKMASEQREKQKKD